MRRVSAWLIVVPLMVAGTEAAHALAYRLVYPQAEVRWQVLAATGHRYLDWAPLLLGVCGALALVGLLASVVDSVRRRTPRPAPPWVFGLLPLAGFALQEFLERWLALGGFPWWMVEQPTFRIGLLLQLPFALLAFSVARVLLRVVERVGIALRRTSPPLPLFGEHRAWFPAAISVPRLSVLAAGYAERGPPAVRVPLSF